MPISWARPFRILVLVRAFMVRCTQRENVPGVPGLRASVFCIVVMPITLVTDPATVLLDS